MNTLFDELTGRNDNNNGKDDYFGRTEMRSSIYSNGKFEFIIYRAKFIYIAVRWKNNAGFSDTSTV